VRCSAWVECPAASVHCRAASWLCPCQHALPPAALHNLCRRSDPALLQQVMQGLPFLSFVEEGGCPCNSQDWLSAAEDNLQECREAEEQLQRVNHAAARCTVLKLEKGTGASLCCRNFLVCKCNICLVRHGSAEEQLQKLYAARHAVLKQDGDTGAHCQRSWTAECQYRHASTASLEACGYKGHWHAV
jgi:hypothetical protein